MVSERGEYEVAVAIAVLFAMLAFLSVGCASANTIYVPDNYAKIQWAVDNASAGDTIIVRDETYIEYIEVNTRLTIQSENGSDNCIVQAPTSPPDHVFEVNVSHVNISGFTVTKATRTVCRKYGAYYKWDEHCINAAGIYLHADHCNISDNNMSDNDIGIHLYDSSSNTLTGNNASSNRYYGINLEKSHSNTLTNNFVLSNLGEQILGGIYLLVSDFNVIANNYFNNTNNAYDKEGDNIWNITKTRGRNIVNGSWLGGNYWSDYRGKDLDGDGLGNEDTPYNSSGRIKGGDYLPLVAVAAIPKPDLVIGEKSEKWLSESDKTYNITYTVCNEGDAPAGACNMTIKIDNVKVMEDPVKALAAGECNTSTVGPFTMSGDNDTIEVCADNSDDVEESNETNNCAENEFTYTGMPDLVVVNKTEEWVSRPEKTYKVRYTVCNNGSADANASHTAIVIDGEKVNESEIPALAAGKCYYNNTFDQFTMSGDNDTIEVCADNSDEVEESNETNNCAENEFTYMGMPDLVVVNKTEEWVSRPEKTYTVRYTVCNNGSADANASHTAIVIDGEKVNGDEIPALAAGKCYYNNTVVPFTMSGDNDTIDVCADNSDEVKESDETNNCVENEFTYKGMPDLVIENKREQWINESNDTYVVWYTIRNIGTANASKGHNTSLFVDGALIESKEVPVELVPLQNYTENFTSILTLSGQSDEITVQADCNNALDESNETNNNRTNVWLPLPAHAISLNASPKTIEANGITHTTITANVTDELGNGVNGAQVNFSTTLGTIYPSFALTNVSGIATITLTSSTSAGTAVINGTVNDTCIEDTARVVFEKFAVAKTNETFTNVTLIVGDANVSGTNVTIRAGNITINTTEENATIIARNATEGSMIPITITNGTLEVTLSADATYENKTVTGTLSSIKLNTPTESYITSKPMVGTATTDLDVKFSGNFTPANLILNLTLREDLEDAANLVGADNTTIIEDNILDKLGLSLTDKNRLEIANNTAIVVYAVLSGTYVENNVTGVPINITVNKTWFDTVAEGNLNNVTMFKISSDTGEVEIALPPEKVVIDGNNVTFCITYDHFSVFALIGQPSVRSVAGPSAPPGDGGGAGGGGGSGPARLFANPGINIFNFEWLGLDITEVRIDLKNVDFNARVTSDKVEKPMEISVPEGNVYGYFEITTTIKSENIKSTAINFRVRKSWCVTNSINVTTIKMCRYTNVKGWDELETEKIKEDDDYIYFSAETSGPGLSLFVITGEKKVAISTPTPTSTPYPTMSPTPTPSPTPIPRVRWFVIMAAIIALAAIVIVFSYWSSKRQS